MIINGYKIEPNADLRNANLYGADLPETDIIFNCRYHVHIRKEIIRIGCEKQKIEFWQDLTAQEAKQLDTDAGNWWKQYK